jgi:hypothetical protein
VKKINNFLIKKVFEMKTKILMMLAILLAGMNNIAYGHECDTQFTYDISITDDCCLEITLNNNNNVSGCDDWDYAFFVNGQLIESAQIPNHTSHTFRYCPKDGEQQISWSLKWNQYSAIFKSGTADFTSCCSCPETDAEIGDWVSFETEYDNPNCDTNQCYVRPVITLPESVTCYEYCSVDFDFNNNYSPVQSMNNELPGYCVNRGDELDIRIRLYRNANSSEASCEILATAPACPYHYGAPACAGNDPCIPENANWTIDSVDYTVPSCPLCHSTMYFFRYYSDECNTTFFYVRNVVSSGECTQCGSTTAKEIFEALLNKLFRDEMKPIIQSGGNVVKFHLSTCWRVMYSEITQKLLYLPCGDECCRYVWDSNTNEFHLDIGTTVFCDDPVLPFPQDCWLMCGWEPPMENVFPLSGKISLPFNPEYVSINPNPANEMLTIEMPKIENEHLGLRVYDINGKIVLEKDNINSKCLIDVHNWQSGNYFVQFIVSGKETTTSFKFSVIK